MSAAGLDDLICETADHYVTRAIELGQNRKALASIKRRLKAGRDTCLLFDTPRLAAHLEKLFLDMWHDFKTDSLPVPDLTNLDVYQEIGIQMDVEHAACLSDDDYRGLYNTKLRELSDTYPVRSDRRFRPDAPPPAAEGPSIKAVKRRSRNIAGRLRQQDGFDQHRAASESDS